MFLSRWKTGKAMAAGAVALTASLMLAGCTPGGGGDASADGVQVTVFDGKTGTITENFNPFSSTTLGVSRGVIYEPLFHYNLAADQEPTPVLGTTKEWNEDGTVLTVTIREGVEWSDGEPFTADDVAYTFGLIVSNAALNTTGFDAVVEAVDDTTVTFTFPRPSFMQEPSVLGNQAIVPEHIWKGISDPVTDVNSTPVGTGPFVLSEFSPQTYVLTKNENYWEKGKPSIDSVRYISLESADSASGALLAGDVDWMGAFLPDIDQMISSNAEVSYVNTPALTASIMTCANADLGCVGPQTDQAVRQALYYALDRDQLNALAGGGKARTASPTMLLPWRDGDWISDTSLKETPGSADIDQANQILDAAGWTVGSDGIREKDGQRLSMTIQTVTGWSDFISLNDAMKQQVAEAGIELVPSQVSWNEWNDAQTKGTFQLSLDSIGLGPSTNPYFTYYQRYNSANTQPVGEAATAGNFGRYSNPAVDAALEAARSTNDPDIQKQQYATIQGIIAEELPYVPIYVNSMLTEFNNTRATGWPTDDDLYAMPVTWKVWDNGIVLKTIVPAS